MTLEELKREIMKRSVEYPLPIEDIVKDAAHLLSIAEDLVVPDSTEYTEEHKRWAADLWQDLADYLAVPLDSLYRFQEPSCEEEEGDHMPQTPRVRAIYELVDIAQGLLLLAEMEAKNIANME